MLGHLKIYLVPETVHLVTNLQYCLGIRSACFQVGIKIVRSCREKGKDAEAAVLSLDVLCKFTKLKGNSVLRK